jgi:hypothetical protein
MLLLVSKDELCVEMLRQIDLLQSPAIEDVVLLSVVLPATRVFGKVVSGIALLKKFEAIGGENGNPSYQMKSVDSGELSNTNFKDLLKGEKGFRDCQPPHILASPESWAPNHCINSCFCLKQNTLVVHELVLRCI